MQNGIPQSMQRLAWAWSRSSWNGSYTSFQSRRRTGTGRREGSSRPDSMKPVGVTHVSAAMMASSTGTPRASASRMASRTRL